MAKAKGNLGINEGSRHNKTKRKQKRTSIGASCHSRPTNKNKKASYKKYRGQGR